MAEGTPSGAALGFGDVAPEAGTQNDPLLDDYNPEATQAPPVEGQKDQQQAPPPQEQAPVEPAQPPAEGQQPAPEGTPPPEGQQPPPERKFADRYQTVEDLEAGYKNIQRLQSRTAEQLRAEQLQRQQMEAALEQLKPLLEQAKQSQLRDPVQPLDPNDPQQLQRLIDERARTQAQEALRTSQQQMVAQQVTTAIDSFRVGHPDAASGTPVDIAMADVVNFYMRNPETGQTDPSMFPITPENLEVAYELAKDEKLYDMAQELDLEPTKENLQLAKEAMQHPGFAEVLLAQPSLLDNERGVAYARKLAQVPTIVGNAQQQALQQPERQAQRAFVETGGASPVSGGQGNSQKDEFDEALAFNASKQTNAFGV